MEHLAVCSFVRLQAYAAVAILVVDLLHNVATLATKDGRPRWLTALKASRHRGGTLQPHGRTRWSLRVEKLVPGPDSFRVSGTLFHPCPLGLNGP
jgi:hypothetical protein